MSGAGGMETVLGKALHAAVCGDPEVCCWTEEGGTCESNTPLGIEAHLAQALRDAGFGHVAAAKAGALRDAADAVAYEVRRFEVGCEADAGYYDAHMEIQRMLRDRADQIEADR